MILDRQESSRTITNQKLCAAARFAGHDALRKYRLTATVPDAESLLNEAATAAAKSLRVVGLTAAERLVFDAEWAKFWSVNGALEQHRAHARQMPRSIG